jgi:hypothetical protein
MESVHSVLRAGLCPHTDCRHADVFSCSGWAYADDALAALAAAGLCVNSTCDINALVQAADTIPMSDHNPLRDAIKRCRT